MKDRNYAWLKHHAATFYVLGQAAALFSPFVYLWWDPIGFGGLTVFFVAFAMGHAHDSDLCERCISNVPVNAQQQAARHKPVLSTHHRLRTKAGSLIYFGAIFASLLVPRAIGISPYWGGLGIFACIITSTYSERMHRRFYPWCPYCKWGRGGDGKHEPSPQPTIPQNA